jgi:hypothetical protein
MFGTELCQGQKQNPKLLMHLQKVMRIKPVSFPAIGC